MAGNVQAIATIVGSNNDCLITVSSIANEVKRLATDGLALTYECSLLYRPARAKMFVHATQMSNIRLKTVVESIYIPDRRRDFRLAAFKDTIVRNPYQKTTKCGQSAGNARVLTPRPSYFRSPACGGGRLAKRGRSTNPPPAEIVMFFTQSRESSTLQQRRRYTKPVNPLHVSCQDDKSIWEIPAQDTQR